MKNLFDYATNELSQDAFLMWLFNNYDCEQKDVASCSVKLLNYLVFGDFDSIHIISDLETSAQEKHIDVLIRCKIDDTPYLIAIEDKVDSNEHNQLVDYNRDIERIANEIPGVSRSIQKIFFKSNLMDVWERDCVTAAGWSIYDIGKIKEYIDSIKPRVNNEILKYYIEHIDKIHAGIYQAADNILAWQNDLGAWHHYLQGWKAPKGYEFSGPENFRNQYWWIKIHKIGMKNLIPSVEIRSKDLMVLGEREATFMNRVVLYDVKRESADLAALVDRWKNIILDIPGVKIQNYSKQIASHDMLFCDQMVSKDAFQKSIIQSAISILERFE